MTKLPVSVIILTYNEELNLPKCLRSVARYADEIIVVDSGSTDRTKAIAAEFGAKVVEHSFTNQAEQFNWTLDNCGIKNEWILRLDADEEILPELWEEIAAKLPEISSEISGFLMKRRVYFMGRWIRHGGYYPTWLLRLFRKGKGRSEEREMDEHILLSTGRAEKLEHDFIDNNLKGLHDWTAKHNNYSTREVKARAEDILATRYSLLATPVARKRQLKGWYLRLPLDRQ